MNMGGRWQLWSPVLMCFPDEKEDWYREETSWRTKAPLSFLMPDA